MKKYLFLLLAGFAFNATQAQDISEANLFAQDNLNGTARFRAMGGAFGALGGDLSSMNVNPAGSAVFANNQFGFTLTNYSTKNNSDYFETKTNESKNAFKVNQAGGVFVFNNRNYNSNWTKFSISANYDNTNNFNNTIFSAGTNPTTSIDQYFLHYANGVPLDVLENGNFRYLDSGTQQAFLGYQGYIINPVTNDVNNTSYTSNVPAGGNYYQENEIYSRGNNSKLTFNMGTSYKDRLFLGVNLNLHSIDYRRTSSFYEDNNNPLDATNYQITRMSFTNDLYTYGTGFSFQVGAIARVTEAFRLGLAYESNSWYNLYDEQSQRLTSISSVISGSLPIDVVDPNIVNIYEPYEIQTPGKWTASAAYVFGKTGLISVDYAIKDYSNTKFKPQNDSYFNDLNRSINSQMTTNGELRIGGEYKIDQLSLRAGYRHEGSPYKNGTTVGDLNSYSGGIGYNFGATKLDLAYSYTERSSEQSFFNVGLLDTAKINTKYNNVSLTLLFEL